MLELRRVDPGDCILDIKRESIFTAIYISGNQRTFLSASMDTTKKTASPNIRPTA